MIKVPTHHIRLSKGRPPSHWITAHIGFKLGFRRHTTSPASLVGIAKGRRRIPAYRRVYNLVDAGQVDTCLPAPIPICAVSPNCKRE